MKIQTPLSKFQTLLKFRATIKKVHEILGFQQEPFLKPYIERAKRSKKGR